jgi:hypothetical protein
MRPASPTIIFLDPHGTIQIAVQRLLDVAMPAFDLTGQRLILNIIIIGMVVFGLRAMLGAGSFGAGTPALEIVTWLSKAVLAYTFMRYYRVPIPGIGYSLVGVIDGEFHDMMMILGRGTTESMYKNLDLMFSRVVPPTGGIFNLLAALYYWSAEIALVVCKALVIMSTGFGLIGQAITRLFAPLCLAFVLVPHLSQLAWNWVYAYINFAFLPVIGMAYIFVMEYFVASVATRTPPGVMEYGYATYLGQVLLVELLFIGCVPLVVIIARMLTGGGASSPGFGIMK